jgi:hypothetical protein
MPERPGIVMSSTMTSGRSFSASSMPARALPASPTTLKCGVRSSSDLNAARTMA